MLVSAYIVERGLILPPYEVESKTNEIKALPELIKRIFTIFTALTRVLGRNEPARCDCWFPSY
jgi:hypothetical protein